MKDSESVDAFGLNCVSSALHMKELMQRIDFSGKTLCVMPNAGYPRIVGNRMFYDSDPGYFAQVLKEIADAGAGIVGACCGTNPQFIAAAASELNVGAAAASEDFLPFFRTKHRFCPKLRQTAGECGTRRRCGRVFAENGG